MKIFVARIHYSLLTDAQMVANIVFFVVSEHASCGSVDNRSSRNASKRVRANRKTQLVSHHCDICKQKANESFATKTIHISNCIFDIVPVVSVEFSVVEMLSLIKAVIA